MLYDLVLFCNEDKVEDIGSRLTVEKLMEMIVLNQCLVEEGWSLMVFASCEQVV